MPRNEDFTYEVIKEYATLSSKGNFAKEVKAIQWGENGNPMIDIRKWVDGKANKGISLTLDEFKELVSVADEIIADFED